MRRNQSIWQWLALKLGEKIHHLPTLKRKQNTGPEPVDCLSYLYSCIPNADFKMCSEILSLLLIYHSSLVAENRAFNK